MLPGVKPIANIKACFPTSPAITVTSPKPPVPPKPRSLLLRSAILSSTGSSSYPDSLNSSSVTLTAEGSPPDCTLEDLGLKPGHTLKKINSYNQEISRRTAEEQRVNWGRLAG